MNNNSLHYRQNKSFARRIGKSLSPRQKAILQDKLPGFTFSPERLAAKKKQNIILEVGFGMGEHFVQMVQENPAALCLGAEVYLNGMVRVLDNLDGQDNYLLWPDDINLLLQEIAAGSLNKIYVLFPDPWPKNREKKRRLLQDKFIRQLIEKLHIGGQLVFGSDIADYFGQVHAICLGRDNLSCDIYQESPPPAYNYQPTKYHQKARAESRQSQFLIAKKTANLSNQD